MRTGRTAEQGASETRQVLGGFPQTTGKYKRRSCCKSSKAPQIPRVFALTQQSRIFRNILSWRVLTDWKCAQVDVTKQGFGIIRTTKDMQTLEVLSCGSAEEYVKPRLKPGVSCRIRSRLYLQHFVHFDENAGACRHHHVVGIMSSGII